MTDVRDPARPAIPGGRYGWFLDDVEPGAIVRHPGGRTITAGEHVWLAWVTDNASDVHGNIDRAAKGAFGRPVVLGALTVAIVVGLAEPAEAEPSDAALAAPLGWSRIRLGSPVAPGDTLRAESTIEGVQLGPNQRGGYVHRTVIGRNQRDEEVVAINERRWVPRRSRR